LTLATTAFEDGSTTAIRFARMRGTQTRPPTTAGSPRLPGIAIVADTVFVFGSIRLSPVGVVIQTAPSPAAVQPAIGNAIRATTAFVLGSILTTPLAPVAQIEPNAPTTPVA
jgi:hypothetical protein